MTQYRILEKKGTQQEKCCGHRQHFDWVDCTYCLTKDTCDNWYSAYIPRFIVQEFTGYEYPSGYVGNTPQYKDLKEFTSLDEARAYKRELKLEEGIVRE